MKIYVASSWRNHHTDMVVASLREEHQVYDFKNPPGGTGFSWSQIDENWQNWDIDQYNKALKHEFAVAGFNSDFTGMKWADACVLVLPCGRSAHTEAGWMAGQGKPVYVYVASDFLFEPELMYKIYTTVSNDLNEIRRQIRKYQKEEDFPPNNIDL